MIPRALHESDVKVLRIMCVAHTLNEIKRQPNPHITTGILSVLSVIASNSNRCHHNGPTPPVSPPGYCNQVSGDQSFCHLVQKPSSSPTSYAQAWEVGPRPLSTPGHHTQLSHSEKARAAKTRHTRALHPDAAASPSRGKRTAAV